MRQLLPVADDQVDPVQVHAHAERPAPPHRPWVLVNMVTSADGAIAVHGTSGELSGGDDRRVFMALRAVADVIMVGGATARAENYGQPRPSPERRAERRARGQTEVPRLAVVSGSLDLDPEARLFTEPGERPLIYTGADAPAEARSPLEARAEIVDAGPGPVDLATVLEDMGSRGYRSVLVEGGPHINGQLVAADLVDELNLTTSPMLVGGDSPRIAPSPSPTIRPLTLAHLWEADGVLLARYVRP